MSPRQRATASARWRCAIRRACISGSPLASAVAYPQLAAADEALRNYSSIVHAVGVRLEDDGRLDIVAPFGLDDMFAMVIRPNRTLNNAAIARRSKARAGEGDLAGG